MAKGSTPTGSASGRGRAAAKPHTTERRIHAVGRPLQARLVALEQQVGLFSESHRFAADSRFHHPVILSGESPLAPTLADVFAAELASLARLGKTVRTCHSQALGPYRVHALSYFHYDGFTALVCVQHGERLLAAWKDEEVLQPDSPRTLVSEATTDSLEAFFDMLPA